MCSSSVRNPQSSKRSSFSSAVARLDCKVGNLWEHNFSLIARYSHTEDLAVAHSGFREKDWLFALSLLIVVSRLFQILVSGYHPFLFSNPVILQA